MAVGRLVEAQQFFAQAFPGDAEQFRRPALVALAGVEGPLYQQALRLFQIKCRPDVRQRFPGGGGACLYAAVARQGGQLFIRLACADPASFQTAVGAQDALRSALERSGENVRVEIVQSRADGGNEGDARQQSRGRQDYVPDVE